MNAETVIEFDKPIDAGVMCRYCGRPIVATARLMQSIELQGFSHYRWLHKGSWTTVCPPPDDPPEAEPYDVAEATRRIQLVIKARNKADDAYWETLDGERWAEQ